MSWKTSFKICGVILLIAAFVTGITIYTKRSARADVKAIALSREDIIAVANLQSQATALKTEFDKKMGEIDSQLVEVKRRNKVPEEFVFDTQGNIIVGFKPKPPEQK